MHLDYVFAKLGWLTILRIKNANSKGIGHFIITFSRFYFSYIYFVTVFLGTHVSRRLLLVQTPVNINSTSLVLPTPKKIYNALVYRDWFDMENWVRSVLPLEARIHASISNGAVNKIFAFFKATAIDVPTNFLNVITVRAKNLHF